MARTTSLRFVALGLGVLAVVAACPAPTPPQPTPHGTAIGGRRVSCKGPVTPTALAPMQPTNQDLAAGKGRACPDCLDNECLLENQIVYGSDAGGFDGVCSSYVTCLCGCTTDLCRDGCSGAYDLKCQRAVGALDACRRQKCVPICNSVLLYAYGGTTQLRDAGPLVDKACRQPPVSGGTMTPCCDLFAHCCQSLAAGSNTNACWSAYGEVDKSESGCNVKILDWIDACPGVQP